MTLGCGVSNGPGRGIIYPPEGFTRTDLSVLLATLSLLAALIVAPLSISRRNARLALCTGNLQAVNRAVSLYANDHNERLPGPTLNLGGDSWWWYKEQIKSYAGLSGASSANDTLFACPMDRGYSDPTPFCRTPRFDYTSYVFNGVSLPGVPNIAGWKVSQVKQPLRTLSVVEWSAHAPLSWHRSRTGRANAPFYNDAESVAGFVDGHVSFTKIYYDGYSAAYTRDPISSYAYQYSGN